MALLSCTTDGNEYFGIVETNEGKPLPPRTVPRNIIGPMPAGTLPSHKPTGIIVMDTGADYDGISPLTYLRNMLDSYHTSKNHQGDLPFHFFIDPTGSVYSGRNPIAPARLHYGDPFTMRYTDVDKKTALQARLAKHKYPRYDLEGYVVICILGDYDNQMFSEEQEKGLYQTIAYLVYQHNISLERIYGLKTLFPDTKNPGFYLHNYLQNSILQKNIPQPPGTHRFLVPEPRAGVW